MIMKATPAEITDLIDRASAGEPRNAVGFLLWRITHRYQREVDRALREHDLTHLQFVTLVLIGWLGRDGAAFTQADVARFGDIHPMQVSKVVKTLSQKNLICREPAPQGGPAQAIALTISGLAQLREALPAVTSVQHRMFGTAGQAGGNLLHALSAVRLL